MVRRPTAAIARTSFAVWTLSYGTPRPACLCLMFICLLSIGVLQMFSHISIFASCRQPGVLRAIFTATLSYEVTHLVKVDESANWFKWQRIQCSYSRKVFI